MDIPEYKEFIGDRIYQLRAERNLSARELSLSLGMSSGYINKIENGKAMPSLNSLFYICMYFNITPEEFFRGIDYL